jgi:hypothetical protein
MMEQNFPHIQPSSDIIVTTLLGTMQLNETKHPLAGGMKYMRILCANGVITLIYLKKLQANL